MRSGPLRLDLLAFDGWSCSPLYSVFHHLRHLVQQLGWVWLFPKTPPLYLLASTVPRTFINPSAVPACRLYVLGAVDNFMSYDAAYPGCIESRFHLDSSLGKSARGDLFAHMQSLVRGAGALLISHLGDHALALEHFDQAPISSMSMYIREVCKV